MEGLRLYFLYPLPVGSITSPPDLHLPLGRHADLGREDTRMRWQFPF